MQKYLRADTQVGPYTTVLTRRGAPVCAPTYKNQDNIYRYRMSSLSGQAPLSFSGEILKC